MGELTSSGKSFEIAKVEVYRAWEKVRSNRGAPGVDGQSLEAFEADLSNNLYKIWNRMSSGTYFPPPVAAVEIDKPHGPGTRVLGIPTVADRVAQTVVAERLTSVAEPVFHVDSYGFRPGRSALDAVRRCQQRCWQYNWVIDLDIQKFFDTVDWQLICKAVAHHTELPWVLLYVKRWLAAPMRQPDGTLIERDRGTPQGSPVSPVLANLFLHYAFDEFLAREFAGVEFERYVDDAVVHCVTEYQARKVLDALQARFVEVGLRLHPDKTRIVYCKDANRAGNYPNTEFTFLGFTFRARRARGNDGKGFASFQPAVSKDAEKKMSAQIRSWRLHRRTGASFGELARVINPVVRGWMGYYGAFHHSTLFGLFKRINHYLLRWARNKYERLRGHKKAHAKWHEITSTYPRWFYHWRWIRTAW